MQEGSTLKVPEALAYGIPVMLGYRDSGLAGLNSECILELPNTEDNVSSNAERIRSFAYSMVGRRIRREDVAPCIDQRLKERADRDKAKNQTATTGSGRGGGTESNK